MQVFNEANARCEFVDSLLHVYVQAIVSKVTRRCPDILRHKVTLSMANGHVLPRPLVLIRALQAPERFHRRFRRSQIIFTPLRHRTSSFRHFARQAFLHLVRLISRILRLPIWSGIPAVIRRRAVGPIVLSRPILPMPDEYEVSPLQATFHRRVRRSRVSHLRVSSRLQAQIHLPYLDRPSDFQVVFLRYLRGNLSDYVRVRTNRASTFVRQIRAMVIHFTMRLIRLLVVWKDSLLRAQVYQLRGYQATVSIPWSQVESVRAWLLFYVVEGRAKMSKRCQFSAVFARPLRSPFLRDSLLLVPAVQVQTTPAFRIIRRPPDLRAKANCGVISFFLHVTWLTRRVMPGTVHPSRHR